MTKTRPSIQIGQLVSNLAAIGDKETDAEQEKVQHHLLVYMGTLMGFGGLIWGTISVYFKLFLPGSIPYGYSILTVLNFIVFNRTKNFQRARFLQVLMSLILPFLFQWSLGGFVSSGAVMLWSMLALVGSMTFYEPKWGIRWLVMYVALTLFSGLIDGYVTEVYGLNLPASIVTVFFVLNISVISSIVFGLSIYLLNLLRLSQGNLENLVAIRTSELNNLLENLEVRVADRTKALETSAEVSRRLASILDPNELASTVVNQIQTAFNYYYAQIYLFDDAGENLVLTAGTGEAGTEMMKRGHRLPKGRGLVGRAADTKKSIFVSDTSQDPNWLPNELLPDTKAEAVVPIMIGEQVLGVLDVQDDVTNDIFPEDITLLESLAGQVAISLQNARQYLDSTRFRLGIENSGDAVFTTDVSGTITYVNAAFEKVYGYSPTEAVGKNPRIIKSGLLSQVDYQQFWAALLSKQSVTGEIVNKHKDGHLVNIAGTNSAIVNDAGEIIGFLAVHHDITDQKKNQSLVEQRARQQEALNLITQRIQSATTIESALQITARELGRALGHKPTLVTLEPDNTNGDSKTDS